MENELKTTREEATLVKNRNTIKSFFGVFEHPSKRQVEQNIKMGNTTTSFFKWFTMIENITLKELQITTKGSQCTHRATNILHSIPVSPLKYG